MPIPPRHPSAPNKAVSPNNRIAPNGSTARSNQRASNNRLAPHGSFASNNRLAPHAPLAPKAPVGGQRPISQQNTMPTRPPMAHPQSGGVHGKRHRGAKILVSLVLVLGLFALCKTVGIFSMQEDTAGEHQNKHFASWFQKGGEVSMQDLARLAKDHAHDLLEAQDTILGAIDEADVDVRDVSYLFIPDHPAQYMGAESGTQADVPYYNQRDPRWGKLSYGTDGTQTLGENGCAITSLAMVAAYFDGHTTPADVLAWSGNTFYAPGQGTSWSIFANFAYAWGYEIQELGASYQAATNALDAGYLLIVSVAPGTYTKVGHLMVLRGHQGDSVFVNDPNDGPDKFHSIRPMPASTIYNEAFNYWAFRPLAPITPPEATSPSLTNTPEELPPTPATAPDMAKQTPATPQAKAAQGPATSQAKVTQSLYRSSKQQTDVPDLYLADPDQVAALWGSGPSQEAKNFWED